MTPVLISKFQIVLCRKELHDICEARGIDTTDDSKNNETKLSHWLYLTQEKKIASALVAVHMIEGSASGKST